jgi:hypothetical protein
MENHLLNIFRRDRVPISDFAFLQENVIITVTFSLELSLKNEG